MFRVVCCGLLFVSSICYSTQLTVVTEQWPPFNYQNEQGEIVGNSTKTVKKILNNSQISYQIKLYPWVRAYKIARNKPNVLIYSIYPLKQRKSYFYWFCPIFNSEPFYVWGLANRQDIHITVVEDLNRYKFAMTRLDFPFFVLKNHGINTKTQVDFSSTDELNLKKLLAKRVDFLVTTKPSMLNRLKLAGLPDNLLAPYWMLDLNNELPLCMALNKKSDPAIVKKLKHSFNKYQQTLP